MWGKVGLIALLSLLLTAASVSYEPGRKSSVRLSIGSAVCTGTVVGPKAVLTAAHCFDNDAGVIQLDDNSLTLYGIVADDGYDHVLVRIIGGVGDKKPAKVGKIAAHGDKLYMWGNPLGIRNQLRVGHVIGFYENIWGVPLVMTVSFTTFPGDSGGGYFNMQGEVVAVHYGTTRDTKLAMAYSRINFTHEDWARALAP